MKRQRIAALIIIVMIAAGSLYLLYPSLFPAEEEQEDEGGKTTNVNYSSLNNLNWWDSFIFCFSIYYKAIYSSI